MTAAFSGPFPRLGIANATSHPETTWPAHGPGLTVESSAPFLRGWDGRWSEPPLGVNISGAPRASSLSATIMAVVGSGAALVVTVNVALMAPPGMVRVAGVVA